MEKCHNTAVSDEDIENLVPTSKTLVLTSPLFSVHLNGVNAVSIEDTFDNYLEESGTMPLANKKTKRRVGYLVVLSLCFSFFLPSIYACAVLAFTFTLIVYKRRILCSSFFKKNNQVRVLKWSIDDFEEKIKSGYLSSPIFKASCCQWRLLVKQKASYTKYAVGLILNNISPKVKLLRVRAQIGVAESNGKDLIPELKELSLNSCFESNGDCGYSDYFTLDPFILFDENGKLVIKCRMEINSELTGFIEKIMACLSLTYKLEAMKKGPDHVFELGSISPQSPKWQSQSSQGLFHGGFEEVVINNDETAHTELITAFLQHRETKTFLWNIPNGFQLMENGGVEIRDFFSPSFVLDSHGLISIWRMKLLELHGVLRLHLQLRGLPKRTCQIKVRYTVEVRDNFGDFVAPEQCSSTAKYGDYLCLWGTTRTPLYSSSAFTKRFVTSEAGISLRVSLQVEPLETDVTYLTG